MLGSLSLGAQASRGHVRLAEIRRANPWHAADRLGPRSPLGGQARGHGVRTDALAASSSDGGATPPAPVVRYLTILTGASRGLGAAIALTLAERGPPLPAAQPEAGPPGTRSSNTSSNCQGEGHSSHWIHDMVLLASDPGRLDAFVRGKLQQAAGSSNGTSSGSRHDREPTVAAAAPPAAVDGFHSLSSAARPQGHGVTRLHTMCFDLGDLDTLESNMRRLLSPAAAVASCAQPRSTSHGPSSPSPAEPSSRDAGNPAAGGALGSGAGGVLPMHPAAYTHVLLVHNAGQVGDLLPLEDQSLANMRRQTDLNVTSFTALTAAVLRTFLHTPVVTPDLGCATPAASPAPASASTPTSARPQGQHADQAQQAQVGRRQISVVNISSVSVDQPYEHFSLYGMGKAARHMVVRCLAHEAALREEAHAGRGGGGAVSSAAGTGVTGGSGAGVGASAAAGAGGDRTAQPLARLRALSYAPGAIDTEMQASAREALPAGRLKAAFEENRRAGRLVDPIATSAVLYDILQADTYDNGAHADYYSATMAAAAAAEAAEAALHPLAAARAAAAVASAAGTATGAGSAAAAGQVGTATSAVVTARA